MSSIDQRHASAFLAHQPARLAQSLSSPLISLLLALLAIVQQIVGHTDGDVSWFITFAEKYVDGAVPYVDITDPNPPAAFLAFAPAVRIARAFGFAVEPVAAAMVFVFIAGAFASSALILRYAARRSRETWGLLLNASLFLFAVAPEFLFAEREHIAVLALLPMLASLIVTAEGGRASLTLRIIAGLGAGVAMCFKPFFALAVALPLIVEAWRARAPRMLLSLEALVAAGVSLAYLAATRALFPAYFDYALPVIAEVYQPARESWGNLALRTLAPFNIVLLAGLMAASARGFATPPVATGFVTPPAARVCAFASLGFLVSFFVQGKGWMNHAYPGVTLALLAWCAFVLDKHPRAQAARSGRLFKFIFLPAFIAAPAMFGAAKQLGDVEEHPGLRAAIARVAPANPRVIALARQLDFGHPVTRQLGGVWVGRANALWTASFANYLLNSTKDPALRARLIAHRQRDYADFAEDVRDGRPDVIVGEDASTRAALAREPALAHVLDDYEKAATAEAIEIWTRKAP